MKSIARSVATTFIALDCRHFFFGGSHPHERLLGLNGEVIDASDQDYHDHDQLDDRDPVEEVDPKVNELLALDEVVGLGWVMPECR